MNIKFIIVCFTIEIYLSRKAIEKRFSVETSVLYDFDFRYFYSAFNNPYLPVITQDNPDEVQLMQWGLIPNWTRDVEHAEKIRTVTYNARSETLLEKASFKVPLKSGRCWVISHGFFEWQHTNKQKIPWYIRLKNDAPFAFAGLYDSWRDPHSGEQLNTFSVITTRANPLLEKIHNTKKRMPVILNQHNEKEWLNLSSAPSDAQSLLNPFPEKEMEAHPVSRQIILEGSDPYSPSIIEPAHYPATGYLFDY